jgi:hypothetical protein
MAVWPAAVTTGRSAFGPSISSSLVNSSATTAGPRQCRSLSNRGAHRLGGLVCESPTNRRPPSALGISDRRPAMSVKAENSPFARPATVVSVHLAASDLAMSGPLFALFPFPHHGSPRSLRLNWETWRNPGRRIFPRRQRRATRRHGAGWQNPGDGITGGVAVDARRMPPCRDVGVRQ